VIALAALRRQNMSRKNRKSKKPNKQAKEFSAWHGVVGNWVKSSKTPYVLLGLILILATGLRLYQLNSPLMWFDEVVTISIATGQFQEKVNPPMDVIVEKPRNTASISCAEPLSEVWKWHADQDVHPPLYNTIFYLWRCLFGDSFASVRILSLLPGIASIFVIFLLGRQLYDARTGLWAALLMSVATPQIVYSHEVRGYALLFFFGLCAALVVARIEKLGPTRWRCASLAFLSFCLAFTHYFSFGFLVALAVYCAIRLRGRSLVCAAAGFSLGAVLFLTIWGPSIWKQFFGSNPFTAVYLETRHNPSVANHLWDFLAAWPERIFFRLPSEIMMRPPWLILIFLLPGVAIIWKRSLLLPWLWLLCTVGFVWGIDLMRETFHFIEIRYTLLAAPAAYLLVAAGIFVGRRQAVWNSILPAILSIILLIQIPKAYTPYKESWVEMAEAVKNSASPTDAVILPHVGGPLKLYWPMFLWTSLSYYTFHPDRPMAIVTRPLDQKKMEQIGWGRGAWIITRIPEFPQSASTDWPQYWIPGCKVDVALALQDRATLFHVTLPEAPRNMLYPSSGN
jgi:uncharacterized membrane protein